MHVQLAWDKLNISAGCPGYVVVGVVTHSSKRKAWGFVYECLFLWPDLQTQLTLPTGFHAMMG